MTMLTVDLDTRRKFRAIIKAVGECFGFDLAELVPMILKIRGKDEYIDKLIDYAHVGKWDSVMWDELLELVHEAKNPYIEYDEEMYRKTKWLVWDILGFGKPDKNKMTLAEIYLVKRNNKNILVVKTRLVNEIIICGSPDKTIITDNPEDKLIEYIKQSRLIDIAQLGIQKTSKLNAR